MVLKVAAVQSIPKYSREAPRSKEGSKRKNPSAFAIIFKAALKKY